MVITNNHEDQMLEASVTQMPFYPTTNCRVVAGIEFQYTFAADTISTTIHPIGLLALSTSFVKNHWNTNQKCIQ